MSTKANMKQKWFFITLGISCCQIKMRALLKILQNDSYALWITSTVWYMRQKMWKILWSTTLTQWWNATGSMLTAEECSRPLLNKRRLQVQPKNKKLTEHSIFEEQKLQSCPSSDGLVWTGLPLGVSIDAGDFANICVAPFTKHQRAQQSQHHSFKRGKICY